MGKTEGNSEGQLCVTALGAALGAEAPLHLLASYSGCAYSAFPKQMGFQHGLKKQEKCQSPTQLGLEYALPSTSQQV